MGEARVTDLRKAYPELEPDKDYPPVRGSTADRAQRLPPSPRPCRRASRPDCARLAENTIDASPTTPEEFAAFIGAETEKWARVVKDAGIQKQ